MIPKKTKFNRTLFVVGDMGATVIILILWAHLLIQASGKLSFVDNRHCFFLKNYEVYVEHFKLSNTIQITRLYHESADHRSNDLLAEFTEMNLYLEKSVLLISEKIDQNKVKLKQLAAQPIEFVNRSPGNHSDGTAAEGLLQQRLRYIYYKFVRLYIVKDTSTFLQYLRILDVNKFLAAARTLTVIMFSSQDADLEAMQTLLQYLWKKYSILNVLAQFPCSDKKEFIFTYKPFRMTRRGYGAFEAYHYRDGLTNPDFLLTDVEQLNGYTLRLAQFERYPSSTLNIPKVLTENPIYVNRGAMKLYGIDAMMMAELQRQMNFSVEMYEGFLGQSYGKVNDDGQAVGSLKAVIDRIIDIHDSTTIISA
ncbi:uncharacterized protein LOC126747364 [Anthonomus grandis grandis]|uniref:uncharacterized protein LOC126747364 n=1 Tax=Anthonomus grandis grandis TaxID=2921223 RepID=UPI002166B035|nr:uncharacterized protein LOC126747364 [Anthonomus grandis grandis]